jgi:hypothetical protein
MHRRALSGGLAALFCAAAAPLGATPLDVWLSATPSAHSGRVELMADMVNDTVDIFNVRDDDARYAGTNAGDYTGWHLQGSKQLTSRWSVDASFWQRRIDFRNDPARFQSWHVGTQYQWLDQSGWRPGSALRLSHWGSHASNLRRSTPVAVQGTTLNSFETGSLKDAQFQGDWVAGWALTPATALNVFGGVGRSRVRMGGAVNATVTQDGCLYNIGLSGSRVEGRLAQRCGDLVDAKFNVPASLLDLDVQSQSNYTATFAQAGVNLGWHRGDWALKGGYLVRQFDRERVDDSLQARNIAPVKNVHSLSSELSYQFSRQWVGALRAEVTSSQLMGEVPSLYNGLTASRLGQRYGLVSVGVAYVFP